VISLNFPQYTTTVLEDWVTDLYFKLHIQSPNQLKPRQIARYFNIFIKLEELPSRYDVFGKYRAIMIDKRLPLEQRREQFFHELCHILRHVGHQSMMPDAFRQLQEWDANHFTMYAALPLHLIQHYDFEDPHIIQHLTEDFRVTEELCYARLIKICSQANLNNQFNMS